MPRVWVLTWLLAGTGCSRPAPEAVAPSAPSLVVTAPSADSAAPIDQGSLAVTPVDGGSSTARPVAARPTTGTVRLSRAAGIDANLVFAVGGGRLYRLQADRWALTPIEGAEARDVIAARGAIWILAKGTGLNAGHALVIRTRNGDDLLAVATPVLGADADPRALVVAHEGEFFIGGVSPALVHVVGASVSPLRVTELEVQSLRYLYDDTLIATHGHDRVTVGRWGEMNTATVHDYFDTVVDPSGIGYLVHAHGEISRGRPGRELQAISTPLPFTPRAAAALGDGRWCVVGPNGPYAEWEHHEWHLTAGDAFPEDPIAIVPALPLLIIGADGRVAAIDGPHVRERVGSGRL